MKKCPSYPGYSVNENGEVFSHRKRKPANINKPGGSVAYIDFSCAKKMSPCKNKKGYLQVSIATDGKIRPIGIHVLVADAFIGPKPESSVVRHLDDNSENNHPSNLAYGSHHDNAQDRIHNKGYKAGGDHKNAKLTFEQAEEIRQLRKRKIGTKGLADMFGVSTSTIESIIYNKSYLKY